MLLVDEQSWKVGHVGLVLSLLHAVYKRVAQLMQPDLDFKDYSSKLFYAELTCFLWPLRVSPLFIELFYLLYPLWYLVQLILFLSFQDCVPSEGSVCWPALWGWGSRHLLCLKFLFVCRIQEYVPDVFDDLVDWTPMEQMYQKMCIRQPWSLREGLHFCTSSQTERLCENWHRQLFCACARFVHEAPGVYYIQSEK